MKTTLSFFSLCSSLLLLFLLAHGVKGADDLISDTCKKTNEADPQFNFNFCVNSLQADPNSHSADLEGLGVISIQLSLANMTFVENRIQQLLKQKEGDRRVENCLENCLQIYSNTIPNVKNAIGDFKSKLYTDANVKMSAALDASVICEDGFGEVEGLVSPLAKADYNVLQLTGISLSITKLLS